MTDPVGRFGVLTEGYRLASVTPPPARHRPGGCRTRSGSVLRLGAQRCPGARRHQQTGMVPVLQASQEEGPAELEAEDGAGGEVLCRRGGITSPARKVEVSIINTCP